MENITIKGIFSDRVKTAYIAAFSLLAIFAYYLLIKIDYVNFVKAACALKEIDANTQTLREAGAYKAYIDKFDSAFLINKDANWLIETLTRAASDEGVKLDSLKPSSGALISDYRIRSIRAEGEASYPDILRFIGKIESREKGLFIEQLTLSKESAKNIAMPNIMAGAWGPMPAAGEDLAAGKETGLIHFELVLSFLSANI